MESADVTRWKVLRTTPADVVLYRGHVLAATLQGACALEGYAPENETETHFMRLAEARRPRGMTFVQEFKSGLPENRRQHVWVCEIEE